MNLISKSVQVLLQFICLFNLFQCQLYSAALGGEKANFTNPMMDPNTNHRQNLCDRFKMVVGKNRTVELKDALKGLQLNVLVGDWDGAYFNYDKENGIDPDYPGIVALILDELAKRGQFTWRNSFGVYTDPSDVNATWTDLLLWGIESYDIIADWWEANFDRMKLGVIYIEEWYDPSLILITKEKKESPSGNGNIWNFLRPYDDEVWMYTIITIIVSGLIYQILEWFADERSDRSIWEWFSENCYLSLINFTQAYEYEPRTLSMRVYGVSMALWALVMTATYTANLASLMIDRKRAVEPPSTFEDIIHFKQKVCTLKGTNTDLFIKKDHPEVIRLPVDKLPDMYEKLHNNKCQFVADTVQSWEKIQSMQDFNPRCDLKQVGEDRKFTDNSASFATAADSGIKCTGLIRDVLNLHMIDIKQSGVLAEFWKKENERSGDIDCLRFDPEYNPNASKDQEEEEDQSIETRRNLNLLRPNVVGNSIDIHRYRSLKAGGKAAAAGAVASSDEDSSEGKLNFKHMEGIFFFHFFLLAVALILAMAKSCYKRHLEKKTNSLVKNINSNVLHRASSVLHWKDIRSNQGTQNENKLEDDCFGETQSHDDSIQKDMKCNTILCNDSDTRNTLASIQETQIKMAKMVNLMFDEQQAIQRKLNALSISQVVPLDKGLKRSKSSDKI